MLSLMHEKRKCDKRGALKKGWTDRWHTCMDVDKNRWDQMPQKLQSSWALPLLWQEDKWHPSMMNIRGHYSSTMSQMSEVLFTRADPRLGRGSCSQGNWPLTGVKVISLQNSTVINQPSNHSPEILTTATTRAASDAYQGWGPLSPHLVSLSFWLQTMLFRSKSNNKTAFSRYHSRLHSNSLFKELVQK